MSTPTSERESQNNPQNRIDSQKTRDNGGLSYRPNYSEDRDWTFRCLFILFIVFFREISKVN